MKEIHVEDTAGETPFPTLQAQYTFNEVPPEKERSFVKIPIIYETNIETMK